MATPQFNIKTGADSSAYFSREITKSDKKPNGEAYSEAELGLIKSEQFTDSDYYNYPVLLRRTGDSLKGSTESIESNELRKGRTKSAPRKGNSSSEGSLDFEFSPETYDDVLEAALRSEWKPWKNDTNSDTNIDGDYGVFQDGFFSMKSIDNNGNVIDIKETGWNKG
ncbi:MAG: phage tail tube protein [Treponema sp.]|nr:MAG: phage tail tube protein [Treponema sp.]